MTGKVFLIGAGPGDPGLLTVKGAACISTADVLVYDRLSSPAILSLAKDDSEFIYVGKVPGHHSKTQDEINDIIVRYALEGKTVARIKGGDPFVFGRGGEEALVLFENNIPFEIVSGVTSAIAAPAYAGIPVTHRNVSAGFHVITGNRADGVDGLDFPLYARLRETLIFLMGIKNLPYITSELMKNGMNPETPAAIVHYGTTGKQRRVSGILNDICQKATENHITSPSVIVIGNVVRLSEKIDWYARKPLSGVSVAVTRSRAQSSTLKSKLEALGAEVCMFPLIKTQKAEQVISKVVKQSSEALVFTSANAVNYYFDEMKIQRVDFRTLRDTSVFSVGEETATALESFGIFPDAIPEKFTGKELAELICKKLKPGTQITLLRSDIASNDIVEILTDAGYKVESLPIYTTVVDGRGADLFMHSDIEGNIDYITFTSSSTVQNYMKVTDGYIPQAKVVCIGEVTAGTAVKNGLTVSGIPEKYTIDGMIDTILKLENEANK